MAIRDHLNSKPAQSKTRPKASQAQGRADKSVRTMFLVLRLVAVLVALALVDVLTGGAVLEMLIGEPVVRIGDEDTVTQSAYIIEEGVTRWIGVTFLVIGVIAVLGIAVGGLLAFLRRGDRNSVTMLIDNIEKEAPSGPEKSANSDNE